MGAGTLVFSANHLTIDIAGSHGAIASALFVSLPFRANAGGLTLLTRMKPSRVLQKKHPTSLQVKPV